MSIVNAGLSILVLIVMVYLRLLENRKYRAMNLRQEIMSRQIEVLVLRVYGPVHGSAVMESLVPQDEENTP